MKTLAALAHANEPIAASASVLFLSEAAYILVNISGREVPIDTKHIAYTQALMSIKHPPASTTSVIKKVMTPIIIRLATKAGHPP